MTDITPQLLDRMRRNIRALGILYLIPAVMLFVAVPIMLILPDDSVEWSLGVRISTAFFVGAFGTGYAVIGFGLRKLRPWSYKVALVFACLGLLAIPIGTIINAIILVVLIKSKPAIEYYNRAGEGDASRPPEA